MRNVRQLWRRLTGRARSAREAVTSADAALPMWVDDPEEAAGQILARNRALRLAAEGGLVWAPPAAQDAAWRAVDVGRRGFFALPPDEQAAARRLADAAEAEVEAHDQAILDRLEAEE